MYYLPNFFQEIEGQDVFKNVKVNSFSPIKRISVLLVKFVMTKSIILVLKFAYRYAKNISRRGEAGVRDFIPLLSHGGSMILSLCYSMGGQ